MDKKICFNDFDDMHILGRSYQDEKGSLVVPWPNAGFEFRTDSSFIKIYFDACENDMPVYAKLFINDRCEKFKVKDGKEVVYLKDLEGISDVVFRRIIDPEGLLSINHIEVGENSKFYPVERKPKKMLFIGDSITTGFCILGDPDNSIYNSCDTDSTETYAYKLSEEFNAEIMNCTWSGRGIVSDCNGDKSDITLPEIFMSKNPDKEPYDHSLFIPDIIIINAGTNDEWGGVKDDEFYEKAMEFLHLIKRTYPGKPIVYFYGAMDQNKASIIQRLMDDFKKEYPNSYFLKTESMIGNRKYMGSVGHPNVLKNDLMKEELSSFLRKIEF